MSSLHAFTCFHLLAAAAIVVGATPLAADGAEVLDQSHPLPSARSGTGIPFERSFAQTFTAGVQGKLSRLELDVWSREDGSDLIIRLLEASRDRLIPSPPELARVVIPRDELPELSFTRRPPLVVDLSALDLAVNPGDVLAIALETAEDSPPNSVVWMQASGNPYSPGDAYGESRDSATLVRTFGPIDMGFRTFVQVVPEPGTLTLVGCFLLGGSWRVPRAVRSPAGGHR